MAGIGGSLNIFFKIFIIRCKFILFSPFFKFESLVIRHKRTTIPIIPTIIPTTLWLHTIVRHIPIPNNNAPTIPMSVAPIVFADSLIDSTYLLMKKTKEAAEMLHTVLTIRQEYAHLGLAESYDLLQQLMNLTNILILSKNTDIAKQTLSTYENLVLEHEGTQTLDNGICQMMYGAIALSEGKSIPKSLQ